MEARKTTEKALVAVIQEAWIGGASTRRVDEIAQERYSIAAIALRAVRVRVLICFFRASASAE